jgi:uncharacterized repeat protein (TIGR02543 family)
MRMTRTQLHQIKALKNVISAFPIPYFERPEVILHEGDLSEEDGIDMLFTSAAEQINLQAMWDAGFDGKGGKIAIIDTGLQLSHRAFQKDPEEPAVSKDDIGNLLATYDFKAKELMPTFDVNQAYKNAKIPFVFDYGDKDADVRPAGQHGTHVAGIIAGNPDPDGIIFPHAKGIAPEAQLYILKVFSGRTASMYAVMDAMEDATLLGADCVNLSLGAASAFDFDDEIEPIFDAAREAGLQIVCSGGNNRHTGYGNFTGTGKSFAQDPDNGLIGLPSIYESSFSIASTDSLRIPDFVSTAYYQDADGASLPYYEMGRGWVVPIANRFRVVFGGQTKPFIDVGRGLPEDYSGLDVAGKIVFAQESPESPSDVIYRTAVEQGAIGVFIIAQRRQPNLGLIQTFSIPVAGLNEKIGPAFLKNSLADPPEKRTLYFTPLYASNDNANRLSHYSTWGSTPALRLKPDIAAPGGMIYSAYATGYAIMSGTSMAAPAVSAAMQLTKAYLRSMQPTWTELQVAHAAGALLMSAATPIMDPRGVSYYAPRRQGAGQIDLANVMQTGAYLTNSEDGRPKVELGDDGEKTGFYSLSFKVHNISNETKTFTPRLIVQTEEAIGGRILNGEAIYYMHERPYLLTTASTSGLDPITVNPGEHVERTVTFALDNTSKHYLDTYYPNGIYVEGYVMLENDTSHLTLPYLGFYGDWDQAPLIDHDEWPTAMSTEHGNVNQSAIYPNTALTATGDEDNPYDLLGNNPYYSLNPPLQPYDPLKWHSMIRNCISPNGDGIRDGLEAVYTGLLRNAREVRYKISLEDGTPLYEKTMEYVPKNCLKKDGVILPLGVDDETKFDPWYGTDADGNVLPDLTDVLVEIEADLPYGETSNNARHKWSFPLFIDNEPPEFTKLKMNNARNFQFSVRDNGMLAHVYRYYVGRFFNGDTYSVTSNDYFAPDRRGMSAGADSNLQYLLSVVMVAYDYAGNSVAFLLDKPNNNDAIMLDKDEIYMFVDEEEVVKNTGTYENPIVEDEVLWTTADASIATVTRDANDMNIATIKGVSIGDTTITCKRISDTCSKEVVVHVIPKSFTIEASSGEGGAIDPSGSVTVESFADQTFTVTPNEGYHLKDLIIDGESLAEPTLIYTFNHVVASHTIHADFAKDTFTVRFVDGLDDTELDKQVVAYGDAATAPELQEHEGYHFVGWDQTFDEIKSDLTVTALYEKNVYTVTFIDDVTGDVLETQQVEHAGAATLPDAPEHYGYLFMGWSTNPINVVSDMDVHALYAAKEYTVFFVDWDGTILGRQEVEYGTAATAPANPTREGYTFIGWDQPFDKVVESMIVTAQYEINVYTVQFVDWDGTVIDTQNIAHGGAATAPKDPSREGYTFTGWDQSFSMVVSDMTITAQYEINTYTVQFVDWDGTVIDTQNIAHGGAATAPQDPSREGYTFTGWDQSFSMVVSDMTITAQYEINTYTVQFLDGEGNVIEEKEIEHGQPVEQPVDLTREGYTFIGWFTNPNDQTTAYDFSQPVTGPLSLYAVWEKIAEPTQPPTEPTQPPTEPTQPPTEPTQPPTEPPTQPPTEPTQPPTEPTKPIVIEPTKPPVEPTEPPVIAPTGESTHIIAIAAICIVVAIGVLGGYYIQKDRRYNDR